MVGRVARSLSLFTLVACGSAQISVAPVAPAGSAQPAGAASGDATFVNHEGDGLATLDPPPASLWAPQTPAWMRAHPPSSTVPAGVRFAIDTQTRLEGHSIVAGGYLINETSAPVELRWVVGLTLGLGSGIAMRPVTDAPPAMPPPPPLPQVLTVPAKTRVRFTSGIELDRYAYPPGGTADVTWSFYPLPASGTLPAQKLPATGPVGPAIAPVPG
jgi:hypothetical protein